MKRWWLRKNAEGALLECRDDAIPQPDAGRMLVRVHATTMNRGDLLARVHHKGNESRALGGDGAGEVLDPGASSFRKGDRVLFRGEATFAEYAVVEPTLAARISPGITDEVAAAVPATFVTAYEGLVSFGRVRSGDWVLICGAGSGVGVAALQIAKSLGARVIGTSGSARKLAVLRDLGADAVVQVRGSGFVEEVRQITQGHGVDVSLNLVGGSAFAGSIAAAANLGRVVMTGYVDGQMSAEIDLDALHRRRLAIHGTSNSAVGLAGRSDAMGAFMRDIFPKIESGEIQPVVDRVFAFDEVERAKAYVESDQHIGKVVVRIG